MSVSLNKNLKKGLTPIMSRYDTTKVKPKLLETSTEDFIDPDNESYSITKLPGKQPQTILKKTLRMYHITNERSKIARSTSKEQTENSSLSSLTFEKRAKLMHERHKMTMAISRIMAEKKEKEPCTFKPELIRSYSEHRDFAKFLEAQQNFERDKAIKVKLLIEEKVAKEQKELTGRPQINSKSARVSPKKNVYLRLHSASVDKKCHKVIEDTVKKLKKHKSKSMGYLKPKKPIIITENKQQKKVNKTTLNYVSSKIDKEVYAKFIEITKDPNAKLNQQQFYSIMESYEIIRTNPPPINEDKLLKELWTNYNKEGVGYKELNKLVHDILRNKKYYVLRLNKISQKKRRIEEPVYSYRPKLNPNTNRLAIKAYTRRNSKEKVNAKELPLSEECTFIPMIIKRRYSAIKNVFEKNLTKKVKEKSLGLQSKIQVPKSKKPIKLNKETFNHHIERMKSARRVVYNITE